MAEQAETSLCRVVVVGGGFSGLTAAVDAAETGAEVVIVEKNPYLGGRVAQLNKYFPKMCPPMCGLEINFRRIKTNPLVTYHVASEIESISGKEGDFTVSIVKKPTFVNDNCVSCNACVDVCPVERANDFNFGLDKTKAIYLPFNQAMPFKYVIDTAVCKGASCAKCVEACKYNAIDLNMKPEKITIKANSVVLATGWNPYDATKMDNLSFGKVKNVITNMMMERLSSVNGPTAGQIKRPSDGKVVNNIAFVQCAGSRDENHLEFCSYICCMASLKQAQYIREQNPDSKVTIYYIDIRTPGKYEQFYWKVKEDANIQFIKGKVAKIEQASGDDVEVEAEDMASLKKIKTTHDMVVLATGMQPSGATLKVQGFKYTDEGFGIEDKGLYVAGCSKNPMDVSKSAQDATGAAMNALTSGQRR
ncbi:MAG: CoB--CoM heterodisulfide reductase iron-sulfur subunit A family protein [Thermodesulfovibrionales bacterium]|nr:CoB--CoM heterodisulfide reductase iron-sulfur subunit A family protein [Thermodesulfovibrionales bacterium]